MEGTATVDATQALQALREVVDEAGEGHCIHECVYVVDGEPYCLIAQALVKLGYEDQVLELDDGGAMVGGLNKTRITGLWERFPELSQQAVDILYTAQLEQDARSPWGNAYGKALSEARRLGYIEESEGR